MASRQRTPEFRAEAVRIALTSGLPRRQVAADLGVGFSTLNDWIRKDQDDPVKPTMHSDMEKELAALRKEVRMLGRRGCPKKGETFSVIGLRSCQ